jgi:ATP-dependent helicase Lhr and Lhr-like helicase
VGEPEQLSRRLVGSSDRSARVVAPDVGGAGVPEVTLDHVGSLANAATVIARLHVGEERLVFCDSRSRVEELAVDMEPLARRALTPIIHRRA